MSIAPSTLFKTMPAPDRHQTQLAYRVHYWPHSELSESAKELIHWRKRIYLTKAQILDSCNADLNILHRSGTDWRICWAYNNMPTQQEWDRCGESRLISVELRVSPAIQERAVAILSWELPSERFAAHARGEL